MTSRKAAFIDRDGTVNRAFYRDGFKKLTAPFSFEELHIFEGAKEALKILRYEGFLCILITNQPDVAYGYLQYEEWRKIQDEVEKLGFDDVFICPHKRDENCECKKPKPGMLIEAQKKWNIDFGHSYMIGDTEKDMVAGRAAGCRTILIKTDYNKDVESDFKAANPLDAAKLISRLEKGGLAP